MERSALATLGGGRVRRRLVAVAALLQQGAARGVGERPYTSSQPVPPEFTLILRVKGRVLVSRASSKLRNCKTLPGDITRAKRELVSDNGSGVVLNRRFTPEPSLNILVSGFKLSPSESRRVREPDGTVGQEIPST